MARQYQIPGGPYVNTDEDGREYQIPGYGYFVDEDAAPPAGLNIVIAAYHYNHHLGSMAS